jgi:uncharacterized protein YbjQ (UPF0145 family)
VVSDRRFAAVHSPVSAVASLGSVGFTPAPAASLSRVVLLPPVVDRIGLAVHGLPGPPRVDITVRTWRALLEALTLSAQDAGAAGLLGVTFIGRPTRLRGSPNVVGEFVELAVSAVPVYTRARPAACFRTAIDASGVATLVHAGWVPVDVLVEGTTQTRSRQHRAADAAAATSRRNAELVGPTDMIQRARRTLVRRFATTAKSVGADGVLLHGGFEVTWSSTYHLVQVSATANLIARWAQRNTAISRSLPMT